MSGAVRSANEARKVSFLDYAPVSLEFGTSGLRGLVKDITDLEAYINVKAALLYLLSTGDIATKSTVIIAGDLRPSTDRIVRASVQAILDIGCKVENAGKIPTPALIYRSLSTGNAGVMVTGSHIPFDRNGIKVNKPKGEILKTDEPGILQKVEGVRAEEYGRTAETSRFDASGMFKEAKGVPPVDHQAEEAYVRRYLTSFAKGRLRGLRIVVYQHSAVGRDILPRILRELGADVVTAGRTETFVALDTENVTDEQLVRLEELVASAQGTGAPPDAIVSTDGDSDRPLVAAIVPADEAHPGASRVRFLSGDLLGIVVAEYLSVDAAIVPISANDAVARRMAERGVFLQATKIGSPYVVSAIDDLRQVGEHSRIVGWEANGGFLCGSDLALASGPLAALPTRDSTLPILANLFAAAEQRVPLSTLWDRLPARFGRSGLLDQVPTAKSRTMLARLAPSGSAVDVDVKDAAIVIDRSGGASSGKPLAEADAARWQKAKRALASAFTPALGFDAIVRINVLDGVRVYFQNGDIAHVRPSGNAPQLRIYANSDSQKRADEIVESGLREPDGILRELLQPSGSDEA